MQRQLLIIMQRHALGIEVLQFFLVESNQCQKMPSKMQMQM